MNRYRIAYTIKEQRKMLVAEANAISDLGGKKLSESGELLLNSYINGEFEIETVQKMMIEKYKEKNS